MSQLVHQKVKPEDLQKLPIIGKKLTNEKEENFLREICEFEFMNIEEPGLSHRFPYGNAKQSHNFTLFHGGKYKLPRFIAQWIESRTTPIWDWRPDGTGGMEKKLIGQKPRFQMRQVFGG
jgi:hypothetical protein